MILEAICLYVAYRVGKNVANRDPNEPWLVFDNSAYDYYSRPSRPTAGISLLEPHHYVYYRITQNYGRVRFVVRPKKLPVTVFMFTSDEFDDWLGKKKSSLTGQQVEAGERRDFTMDVSDVICKYIVIHSIEEKGTATVKVDFK